MKVNGFHSILLKGKLVYSLRLTQKNSVFGMLNSEVHHSVSAQNKQTYLAPWSENIIKISLSSKERKEKSGTANSEDVSKLSDLIRC